jgi:hypothetical protein
MLKHVLLSAAASFALASAAQATLEISTTGRAFTSNVRVVGTSATIVGPVAPITGRTAPGYTLSNSLASFVTNVGLGNQQGVTATLSLGSGAIATAASANGTTPADTTNGSASADVNALAISLFTSTGGPPTSILNLTADRVQSLTSGNRTAQATILTGQSVFNNLALSINGNNVFSLASNAQVAANFVVYNQNGLRVILNQQFASDYDSTRVLITNAIGINFTNHLLDGRSLSGNIVVGQSLGEFVGAASDPVPEPATWVQLMAGFALAGSVARRRPRIRA